VRVPRLLGAQEVPRTPQLEVAQRDPVSRSERGMVFQHAQPLVRLGIDDVRHQQVAEGPAVSASHAPPQLVELRQPELGRVVNDHGVRVGDVETRLHDHGRDEDVHLPRHEPPHHAVEIPLPHLAVAHRHARPRRQRSDPFGHRPDGLDPVVHEVHLTAPVEFPRQRFLEQGVVPRLDERDDGRPVPRRCLDQRQVPQPRQREMQGAGNGGGGEREHVHLQAQRLEPLLVAHAEAVLLVHHQQAQIVEPHVRRQQPVGPDHDVHRPLRQRAEHGGLLGRGPEAREDLHPDREVRQPLAEGAAVLLGQDRRGHEHRRLLSRLHRLEGRAHGHLGLAVAHVADHQSVHGAGALHVALHLLGGPALVGRVLIEEPRLQLALPPRVGRETEPRRAGAARVEIHQLRRHLPDGPLRLLPLPPPPGAAQAVQPRRRAVLAIVRSAVPLDLVDTVQRDVEPVAPLVLDHGHVQGRPLADRDPLDAAVDADAVLEVHHEVARRERAGGALHGLAEPARPPDAARAAEDLVIGQHRQAGEREPALERPQGEREVGREPRAAALVPAEDLLQPLELSFVVAQDERGCRARHALEHPHVPVDDRRGRHAQTRSVRRVRRQLQPGEPIPSCPPVPGRQQERLPPRDVFPPPARDVEVVRGLVPHPVHFDRLGPGIGEQQRVRGEQLEQRLRLRRAVVQRLPRHADRQDRDAPHLLLRSLRVQVERAHGDDLVTPPFDPGRRRHPEPVRIHEPAAHGELRHVRHRGYPLVPHRLQARDHVLRAISGTGGQLEPRARQRARHPRALGRGAQRGHHHPGPPRHQRVQRLDPLPGDLVVRLLFPERLPLRVEPGDLAEQRGEVGMPALGAGRRGGHDHQHALRRLLGKRRRQHGPARARQRAHGPPLGPARQRPLQRAERRERAECRDETGQHQDRDRPPPAEASASSTAASASAATSSTVVSSARRPENAARTSAGTSATTRAWPSAARVSRSGAVRRSDSRGSGRTSNTPTVSPPASLTK
jgi:hypothetical protein